MKVAEFGKTSDGRPITSYTLTGGRGAELEVLDYGGKVRRLSVPDRQGICENIAMSLDFSKPGFGGSLIGRYANRIAGGSFPLEGRTVQVSRNRPPHCIHGGAEGFDKKVWTLQREEEGLLRLAYTSPDGEEGFPGTLRAEATFDFSRPHTLEIRYEAETDAPTVNNQSKLFVRWTPDKTSSIDGSSSANDGNSITNLAVPVK